MELHDKIMLDSIKGVHCTLVLFSADYKQRPRSCRVRCRIRPIDTSSAARPTFESTRDSKRKCSSGSIIGCRPEASMMSFDNGSTDRSAHSHTIGFRCIESFEELVRGLRRETDSRILHAKAYSVAVIPFSSDN